MSCVLVAVLGLHGWVAAQQPMPIDGLLAADWRERNRAALALCEAAQIDEERLIALLDGTIEGAPEGGDGEVVPVWHSAIGLAGGVQGPLDRLLDRSYVWLAEQPGPSALLPRIAKEPRDLCIRWSSRVLAVYVARARNLRVDPCLDALMVACCDHEPVLATNAAAALVRAGPPAAARVRRLVESEPARTTLLHAICVELVAGETEWRDAWLESLAHPDPAVRTDALRALDSAAPPRWSDDRLFPAITSCFLHDHAGDRGVGRPPDPAKVTPSRLAGWILRCSDRPPVDRLLQALDSPAADRSAGLLLLVAERAAAAAPRLLAWLKQHDGRADDAVIWSILALGEMELRGEQARAAVEYLLSLAAGSGGRRKRVAVAVALGGTGDAEQLTAKNLLLQYVAGKDRWLAEAALRSLCQLGLAETVPSADLRRLASFPDPELASMAVELLLDRGVATEREFLRELLSKVPILVHHVNRPGRLAALMPDLACEWVRWRVPHWRWAGAALLRAMPREVGLEKALLNELREVPAQDVRTAAWMASVGRVPVEELELDLREWITTAASDDPRRRDPGLLELVVQLELPKDREFDLLDRLALIETRALERMLAIDPAETRRRLCTRLQQPSLARPMGSWLVRRLCELAPVGTERAVVEEALTEKRVDLESWSAPVRELTGKNCDVAWVRALGRRLQDSADPALARFGSDLVWELRARD